MEQIVESPEDRNHVHSSFSLQREQVRIVDLESTENNVGFVLLSFLKSVFHLKAGDEWVEIAVELFDPIELEKPWVESEPENEIPNVPDTFFDFEVESLPKERVVIVHFLLGSDIVDLACIRPPSLICLDEN